jgi:GGDEF domain-containing protein
MPTKKELLAELAELKNDKAFGILTRPALEIENRKVNNAVAVVFLDLDGVHGLNDELGHDEVNRRIKSAIHVRCDDLILSGRWYSGDELAFVVKGDPQGVADRLMNGLKRNGLSATIAYAPIQKELEQAVNEAKRKVEAAKKKNTRGIIVR